MDDSNTQVGTIAPVVEFGPGKPIPIDRVAIINTDEMEYVDQGAGGVVYRDGKGSVYKIFRGHEEYPHKKPDALLEERLEEIHTAVKFGRLGIAPEFQGVVTDQNQRLGFRMEEVRGIHFYNLPIAERLEYKDRVLDLAGFLELLGYGSLGDLELMIERDKGQSLRERSRLLMVDLTCVYPLSLDKKQRQMEIAQTRSNLLQLVDSPRLSQ